MRRAHQLHAVAARTAAFGPRDLCLERPLRVERRRPSLLGKCPVSARLLTSTQRRSEVPRWPTAAFRHPSPS